MTPFIETTARLASMRQIHSAIEHLHRGDFECAITLAAAGEGILPPTDKPHFRQKVKELAASLPEIEKGSQGPNDYINWLKHGTLEPGGKRIENATITDLEVMATIWRAITKYEALYVVVSADRTRQMIAFANWARDHLQNAEKTKPAP